MNPFDGQLFYLLSHTAELTLFSVVKQRLQARNSSTRTVLSTFQQIYRTEGLSALWISYPTTLSAWRRP